MVRKLLFITVFVFSLSSLLAHKAFIVATKGAQGTSPCEILPEVKSIAFSPDSKYLVAVGSGNLAQLWDTHSGKKLNDLYYKDGDFLIYRVLYSPDGKYIAASTTEDVAIWNSQTAKLLYMLKGDAKDITLDGVRIAFTPDSNYLLVSDTVGSTLWDIHSGKKTRTFSYRAGWERSYPEQISLNGKYLLTSGDDDVLLWNVETGEIIKKFGYDGFAMTPDATFLPDGENILISASHAQEHGLAPINIWNMGSQQIVQKIKPELAVGGWYFSPNGKYILIVSGAAPAYPGGLEEIWSIENYTRLHTITPTNVTHAFVTFLPDSNHFLVGPMNNSGDYGLYDVWNLQTAQVENSVMVKEGFIFHTKLSPDSRYIAIVTGEGGTLQLRSAKTLDLLRQFCL
jgi:WD40 repeat protein